jgi:two-component system, chemotaxis family, chemotaxis protein CheY
MDKNINILVVDDYKTMRRVIHSLLNQLGFQNIDEAINGSDALEKMKEKKYQLIVSDWNMSPVTGIELLKKIRADNENKNIPFLMVTAESKPENVMEAKKSGASNYIVKPFTVETLETKLSSILKKS